jgi:hypothetical protein
VLSQNRFFANIILRNFYIVNLFLNEKLHGEKRVIYCTCTVYASQVKQSYIKQLDKFALAANILFSPVSC